MLSFAEGVRKGSRGKVAHLAVILFLAVSMVYQRSFIDNAVGLLQKFCIRDSAAKVMFVAQFS